MFRYPSPSARASAWTEMVNIHGESNGTVVSASRKAIVVPVPSAIAGAETPSTATIPISAPTMRFLGDGRIGLPFLHGVDGICRAGPTPTTADEEDRDRDHQP